MTDRIETIDLKAAWLTQKTDLEQAFASVLDSGRYILGPQVEAFEAAFAEWCGGGRVVGVANGTDAITLSLLARDIGPGDAVLTVGHTAVATVAAIEHAGARPVLVDIDPNRFTLSPRHLQETLQDWESIVALKGLRPKAVIVVHLYGQPAELNAIRTVTTRHGLDLIEDCAQAHGASYRGEPVGAFGIAATFSFYPTKNLGAFGDGGAVLTRDSAVSERLRHLRQYGWKDRYVSDEVGMNSRLDELQAALLGVRLRSLSGENARRREISKIYSAQLSHLSNKGFRIPFVDPDIGHAFHQYVVRSGRRDRLREFLSDRGVGTLVHYPVPVHLQRAYSQRILTGPGGLPATEAAAGEVLSLPVHPWLTDSDIGRVCETVDEFHAVAQ